MTEAYQAIVTTRMLDQATFHRARFSGRRKGAGDLPWKEVEVRPVQLKDQYHLQFSYFTGQQDITKNYRPTEARLQIKALLDLPFRSIQVVTQAESLRVQLTKKGKAILHRAPSTNIPLQPNLHHDRRKAGVIDPAEPPRYLHLLGITTAEGRIKARMRDKFRQINAFLKLVDETPELHQWPGQNTLRAVDFGCGNAYLTFAAYDYLSRIRGYDVSMVGVDLKGYLIQRRSHQAEDLAWDGLDFEEVAIQDYRSTMPVDLVLALHACDTATDEALAQAIAWGSRFIFSAPCCHHQLQTQLPPLSQVDNPAQRPLLRHGILRERLGDILTDTLRALILRLLGYRTEVLEFVATEHTARNLLIRAVKTSSPGAGQFRAEYEALKQSWGVTPYLETLLNQRMPGWLDGRPAPSAS